jgi:hypothetical protein
MKNKYPSWKETTSTSPSGRHLGHKHTLLKPDGLVRHSEEFQHLDAARHEIWGMHHMMLSYGLNMATALNAGKGSNYHTHQKRS